MSKITIDNLSTPAAAATETLLKTVAPNGYLNLPVDPSRVAELLGIQPQKLMLDPNVDGLLVKDKSGEPFKGSPMRMLRRSVSGSPQPMR